MARKHQPKKQKMWSHSWAVPVAVVLVGAVTLWALPKTKDTTNQNTTTNASPTFSITTNDGIKLAAEFTTPTGVGPWPAVILVHDFAADHHQWDSYVKNFTSAGFAVLAYDIRGFGGSKLPAIPTDQATWMNSMLNDIPAAVNYAKTQPHIDQKHISIIGAGLGAQIAFAACGSQSSLYRTVLLTPKLATGTLGGDGITTFSPTGVLGVSDLAGQENLAAVMSVVHGQKSELTADQVGTGADLLKQSSVMTHVLSWVRP